MIRLTMLATKDQIKDFIDTYTWHYTQFFPDLPGEQHILLAFIIQGMGIKNQADMIKFSGKYSSRHSYGQCFK
jgi:hypothetical protein